MASIMVEQIKVRAAAQADVDEIVRLMRAQLAEHGIDVPGDRLREAVEGVFADPGRGCFLLADEGRQAVGIAYLSFQWSMEHGGGCVWLEELYVLPECRERGIGGLLLNGALQEARARGCRAVDLEVDESHRRSESLYERAGFVRLPRNRWVKQL